MNPAGDKATLMIVDDLPMNIRILSEAFIDDYAVVFATSGKEALAVAAKTLPDLILLDVMMPDLDGYQVCKALKEDPLLKDIPVIFISAMTQHQDEINGLKAGAVDYIFKPYHPDVVRLRVKNQLELKMLRDNMARLSLMDGLTGLANRRAFDQALTREWLRGCRSSSDLSLVMLDIDFFKNYNDLHGHLAGDDCLRTIARVVQESLRASDVAARYGGEEFACILQDTDRVGAYLSAERIRSAIAARCIPHGASPAAPQVTVSLGVATMMPAEGTPPQEIIRIADTMLYEAKHAGRNRVGGILPEELEALAAAMS